MATNELRISIIGDASSAYEALQKVNEAIGTSAARAEVFTKALEKAEQQGHAFAEALGEAAGTLEEFIAQEDAATVATETFTQAQNAAAAGVGHAVPQMQAASGALRELEGNFTHNIRAAERFLTTTLGLGPVLSAAFPVIGAAAFLGILVDIGEELNKQYNKYISIDAVNDELFKKFQQLSDKDFVNVESIETATDRLSKANDEASRLRTTAQEIHDFSFKDLFGELATGNLAGVGLAVSGLVGAKDAAEAGAKRTLQAISLQEKQLQLQHELTDKAIEAAHAGDSALEGAKKINAELEKKIALAKEDQAFTRRREQLEGNLTDKNAGATAEQLAELTARREAAAQNAEMQKKAHAEVAQEAIAQARQAAELSKQIDEDVTEFAVRQIQLEDKARVEAERAHHEMVQQEKADEQERLRVLAESTAAQVRLAQEEFQSTEKLIQIREKAGLIKPSEAAAERKAAVDKNEQSQITAISTQQAAYDPKLGDKQLAEFQKLEDQMTLIAKKAADQRAQINAKANADTKKSYDGLFTSIEGELQGVMDIWLRGGESMARAWTEAADKMAIAVINALVRIAAQELIGLVLHKTIGAQQRLDDAKSAAAGAYKAVVGIPYVGPFLAPPAAAVAFAAVAAFESGTDYVPRTGLAMLHEGERVTPRAENLQISKLLGGGGGGQRGGDIHFHNSPTFSAIDGASVAGMASAHNQTFTREAMRQMRLANRG